MRSEAGAHRESEIGLTEWLRSVPCAIRLLAGGRIHLARDHVGLAVRTSDGRVYVPFRETQRESTVSDATRLAVVHPRFALPLMPAHARFRHWLFRHVCIVTTPFFVGLAGFRTKLWMVDPVTGDFAGLYEWESAEGGEAYARGLARILRAISKPDSVTYELVPDTTVSQYLAHYADPMAVATQEGASA